MSHPPRAFVAVAVALLAAACHPGDTPGVPLYPNGATTRLPRNQVAQVAGPIEKIDGQNVLDQGGLFDLLPGCHVVELDRRATSDNYSLTGAVYFSGQFPATAYALRMKPGARYIIRRQMISDGNTGRLVLSAREEESNGAAADLEPMKSDDELRACKDWAAATQGR